MALSFLKRLLAGAALLAGGATTAAAEPVTLKFADWFPLTHYALIEGWQPWIENVQAASGGEITIEYYPAQQLGKAKDMLALVQSGVADIAHVAPAYISDKFPLSGVAELPGLFDTTCLGTRALTALVQPGGALDQQEYAPNGVRVLWVITYPAYKVVTAKQKVEALADLEGLKIRTAGGAMDITAAKLGAVPVKLPGPDMLPSLQRGTLDGTVTPLLSIKPFDLQTVIRYMTNNINLGSFVSTLVISERAWQSLSAEQQRVLLEQSAASTLSTCAWIDEAEHGVIAELQADGLEQALLPAAELDKLEPLLAAARAEWAATLDGLGRPATAILQAYEAALEAAR